MNERRKTFRADVGTAEDVDAADFQPAPIRRPDPAVARRVAEEGGYADPAPTRAAGDTQRRHRTGRTAQLNLKVTPENRARFAELADAAGVSMNVLFERALQSLVDRN